MQRHQLDHMQTICTRSRQITTATPHHSIFTGRMLFLTLNQQRTNVCRYNWHSAGSLGWPFSMVLYSGTLSITPGMRKISPRQVDRIVDTTVRRSSLWITPTTVDASLLDARSLLHVGRLLPSYSVITLRDAVAREGGGTPFRQIFWNRNGAPANSRWPQAER